ncbi:hypothetical protein ACNZ61_002825 [Enterococcus hirae]
MTNKISDKELMKRLEELGTFLWLDPEADEKDYRFRLNLNMPNLEYNGFNDFILGKDGSYTVGGRDVVIDINVLEEDHFEIGLCHSTYNVSGLENLQKLVSIGYGSPFSIELKRRGVGWVSYSVKVPMLTVYSIYQLEKHIETLRYLIVQIMNTVKLDID